VPIYAEPGLGGGYALLDSYRTQLTGLTNDEQHALFMLNIPAPLTELGVSGTLKSAFLKLLAALPPTATAHEKRVRQRIHLDSTWWSPQEEPVPHLQTIQQAMWQDQKLQISYFPIFKTKITQVVSPYGLVAKAGDWYVVYACHQQMLARRVAHLLEAQLTGEFFERRDDFDLAKFWQDWCAGFEQSRAGYPVTVRVAPLLIPELSRFFGNAIHCAIADATPDEKGWIMLTLPFENLESARERLLGFGGAIEVLAPPALRWSMLDYARQIMELYQQ
jgi:predicted DNA-binding transcriptional regulator YafY